MCWPSTGSSRFVSSKFLRGLALAALAALALTSCTKPAAVRPALWLVEGPGGQRAWLFGTIHALPQPVDWHSPKVDAALAGSDRLLLEVAKLDDDAGTAQVFAGLAESPGLLPLSQRVPGNLRDELGAALKQDGFAPGALDHYETWAAALMLQNAALAAGKSDSGNGIDRALLRSYSKPVDEFEGAAAQLAIFDQLPEPAQRALLAAALDGPGDELTEMHKLEQAWATGDLAMVNAATSADFLRNPELRAALLVSRNRAWVAKLTGLLLRGAQPFVAVGLAHLVGADGLPALLSAQGYTVTRLQ